MYFYVFLYPGIMGPKADATSRTKIQALRERLCDELIECKTNGSLEDLKVHPNEDVEPQWTQTVSR